MILVLAMLVSMGLLVAVAVRQEERLEATLGDPRSPRPDPRTGPDGRRRSTPAP